jgi:hypothetical protein
MSGSVRIGEQVRLVRKNVHQAFSGTLTVSALTMLQTVQVELIDQGLTAAVTLNGSIDVRAVTDESSAVDRGDLYTVGLLLVDAA